MKWKTNGVDFNIWVHAIYISVWWGGGWHICAYKQNSVSTVLFSQSPTNSLPSLHPRPASQPCSLEVAEVLPLPPQQEKVMRFRAPYITRRMRNLIIKERHVAVRKICLFVFFFLSPLPLLLPTFIVSPRETKVTLVFCSLNLALSNLSR